MSTGYSNDKCDDTSYQITQHQSVMIRPCQAEHERTNKSCGRQDLNRQTDKNQLRWACGYDILNYQKISTRDVPCIAYAISNTVSLKRRKLILCDDIFAQTINDDFKVPDKDPIIAVSVDMMDTGIDVPQYVNIVFFKIEQNSKNGVEGILWIIKTQILFISLVKAKYQKIVLLEITMLL